MLRQLTPVEYVRPMGSGRTKPLLIVAETPEGLLIDVVAKFSAGCDQGVANLAREAVAACLAGDLGLPIPEPFLVKIAPEWLESVKDSETRSRIKASSGFAFGSQHITGQYSVWSKGTCITEVMLPNAAAVFAFDAIVQNADRRADNPNCLVRGDGLLIFDHETTFTHKLVIGWTPPWVPGGLKVMQAPGFHIFREQLRQRRIDFDPIRKAWSRLSNGRVRAYAAALPEEWAAAAEAIQAALRLIVDAREKIDDCLLELQRVLR